VRQRASVDARPRLFDGLIDDAALFPPARESMARAIAGYVAATGGPHAWIAGRFICPASRLAELGSALETVGEALEDPSVIVVLDGDGPVERSVTQIGAATGGDRAPFSLAAVECVLRTVPGTDPAEAVAACLRGLEPLPESVSAYIEIPSGLGRAAIAAAVAAIGRAQETTTRELGAKVRCGGVVAEAFPRPTEVAWFLSACAEQRVRVKATAGLHHPLRHVSAQTGFHEHGFLNLLAACGMALEGTDEAGLTAVLADEDPGSFGLADGSLVWRDSSIEDPRRLLRSYGSCSFTEPIEDLIELGWLKPVGA
jgi:hypothetical protein